MRYVGTVGTQMFRVCFFVTVHLYLIMVSSVTGVEEPLL